MTTDETIASLVFRSDEEYADFKEWWANHVTKRLLDAALAREARLREWAVERWHAEVANRPFHNIHRRILDDTWRQVIRYAGGNPVELVGPAHDALSPTSSQDLWLPIDSAPKDGSPILVNAGAEITTARWRPTPSQANGYWALCIYGDFASSDEVVPDPTHWQPLPPCKETRH